LVTGSDEVILIKYKLIPWIKYKRDQNGPKIQPGQLVYEDELTAKLWIIAGIKQIIIEEIKALIFIVVMVSTLRLRKKRNDNYAQELACRHHRLVND